MHGTHATEPAADRWRDIESGRCNGRAAERDRGSHCALVYVRPVEYNSRREAGAKVDPPRASVITMNASCPDDVLGAADILSREEIRALTRSSNAVGALAIAWSRLVIGACGPTPHAIANTTSSTTRIPAPSAIQISASRAKGP
jgi:hypothetical protein